MLDELIELTNAQIALLCDFGECELSILTVSRRRDMARLISGGYVEATADYPASPFQLTVKGSEVLAERLAWLIRDWKQSPC